MRAAGITLIACVFLVSSRLAAEDLSFFRDRVEAAGIGFLLNHSPTEKRYLIEIDIIRRSLAGESFVPAAETFLIERSRPQGHVQAVLGTLRRLGLETAQRSRQRDLVVALVVERLLAPCSKLATARLAPFSTMMPMACWTFF